MTPTQRPSGFTLMEVLIAAVIAAGLLTVVYTTWFGTTRSVDRCAAITDSCQSVRTLLAAMTRQLRTPGLTQNNPAPTANDGQNSTPVYFQTASKDSDIFLKLITTSGVINDPDFPNGPFEAEYKFDPQKTTVFYRQRNHRPISARGTHDADVNDSPWMPLADKIQSIELSYYDGEKWHETWDRQENKNATIPQAVKIKIVPTGIKQGNNALATTVLVNAHNNKQKT